MIGFHRLRGDGAAGGEVARARHFCRCGGGGAGAALFGCMGERGAALGGRARNSLSGGCPPVRVATAASADDASLPLFGCRESKMALARRPRSRTRRPPREPVTDRCGELLRLATRRGDQSGNARLAPRGTSSLLLSAKPGAKATPHCGALRVPREPGVADNALQRLRTPRSSRAPFWHAALTRSNQLPQPIAAAAPHESPHELREPTATTPRPK